MNFKKTSIHALIAPLLISGGFLTLTNNAYANDSEELEKLRALVQELDQKVRVLDRKGEIAAEESAAKKKETPVLVAGDKGFALKSADGNFEYALKGLLQFDYRDFQEDGLQNVNQAEGFTARRIRPTFQGTLFGKYDFRFTPEFGESVNRAQDSGNSSRVIDAYVDARFLPTFKVRAGKFKPWVGLERQQSGGDIKFIERSYVSNNILPNRDLGASVYGDVLEGKLSYAVGAFNGVADGAEGTTLLDTNDDKDYAARIFTTPFKGTDSVLEGLGLGIAATYGDSSGVASTGVLGGYKTPGQASTNFFTLNTAVVGDGQRTRWTPQAYYYYGPFGLLAEYAKVSNDVRRGANRGEFESDAWQVAGSWLLTGESASFKGVKPRNAFETGKDGWGAWELVARYQQQEIDNSAFAGTAATQFASRTASAKSAKTWGAGVNWYLNQWVKLAVNYEQTKFENGGGGTFANPLDRDDEKVLLSRLQFQF
jgi:phosphate-selective porin OprO/OprP